MITKAECQPSTLTTSQVNEEAVDAKKQGKEEEKTIMNSSEDECESGRMSVSSVVQASDTSTSAARRVEKVQDSPKEHFFIREKFRQRLAPHGWTLQAIPLALCLLALALTFAGSWGCSYFKGATISFTGGEYGLWTMQASNGKCQRWDVLFFSYRLGDPLVAARVFSMTSMLLGLAIGTAVTQATQTHFVSWGMGLALLLCFVVSLSTAHTYNMWIVFWVFSYVVFILIVRAFYIHPVHRRISTRGCKIIAAVKVFCAMCCLLTLVVLESDFCTCNNLTAENLEGRDPGDACVGPCELGKSAIWMIVASAFWLASAWAVLRFGIQPPELAQDLSRNPKMYAHYPQTSVATRIADGTGMITEQVKNMAALFPFNQESPDPCDSGDEDNVMEAGGVENQGVELNNIISQGQSMECESNTEDDVMDGDSHEDEHEKLNDTRSYCHKMCCDYRVTQRNKKEQWAFWTFRVALGFLVAIYIFIIVVLIGSRVENTRAAKAPDTSPNFITDVVCAFNPLDPSQPFETFSTKEDAVSSGYLVAHCGACGLCSNPEDIKTYVDTRKTIANKSKQCGVKAIFGSYNSLLKCLESKIGFTRDCTTCWADNMKSTASKCIFTCIEAVLTGFMGTNNVPGAGDEGWLNSCLYCDEKRSGSHFVTCSGVARRRLGIESEIERNPKELCENSDVDWLDIDWEKVFPNNIITTP